MTPTFVPVLPETAPFTPEQRAYLNGFLAGLFSHAAVPNPGGTTPAPAPTSTAVRPLSIYFGTQTGTCETLAKRLAKEAGKHGFAATVHDLGKVTIAHLAAEKSVLVLTSTYGDGEPPDNAKTLWDTLQSDSAPRLNCLHYSVCALGDSSYSAFCGFGKALDRRLEQLGARRIHPRVDCDLEYEVGFSSWLAGALNALRSDSTPPVGSNLSDNPSFGAPTSPTSAVPPAPTGTPTASPTEPYGRNRPYPARLLTNRRLNRPGSDKDVRHFEMALGNSGLAYEAGDALAVHPQNDPALVAELLGVLGIGGEVSGALPDGGSAPLQEALLKHYEIAKIPRALWELLARRSGRAEWQRWLTVEAASELNQFLRGRDVVDLLRLCPEVKLSPSDLLSTLRKLPPRLYSISSSPKAHPGEVHLTVGAVRYESHNRKRLGVCSTFLADRVGPDTTVPVSVHTNKAFRPPAGELPLIMVGPGTGIAPFRAFLEERHATGAKGPNWLFFGDQKSSTDFLYQEELEGYFRGGLLTRLDLAWSRDQAGKVYVQDKMRAQAAELYRWLQDGAGFYVCGDASRMAKDVDAALHQVIETAGGRTPERAAEEVQTLKTQRRYLRDVY